MAKSKYGTNALEQFSQIVRPESYLRESGWNPNCPTEARQGTIEQLQSLRSSLKWVVGVIQKYELDTKDVGYAALCEYILALELGEVTEAYLGEKDELLKLLEELPDWGLVFEENAQGLSRIWGELRWKQRKTKVDRQLAGIED